MNIAGIAFCIVMALAVAAGLVLIHKDDKSR